jgi:hypothetical protein
MAEPPETVVALRLKVDRVSAWALSGITRFASGLPVTFASSGDYYLVQVQNNGVNATSIDMPNCDGTGYKLNHNPRNGKPYFNTTAFTPNALGRQGNSKRRMFYGPGIDNYSGAARPWRRELAAARGVQGKDVA